MNRTLHGIAQIAEREDLRASASAVVRAFLTDLSETRPGELSQVVFDDRHHAACTKLCATYSAAGFAEFRFGQVQKWLNMTLTGFRQYQFGSSSGVRTCKSTKAAWH